MRPLAISLLFLSPAFAEVCSVDVPDGGGVRSCGKGVYIGNGLVLTAKHVIRDRRGAPVVTFKTGQSKTTHIYESQSFDLAGLCIEAPAGASPTPLAGKWPTNTEPVTTLRTRGMPVRGARNQQGKEIFTYTGHAVQGDSGGPVWNSQRELVSLVCYGDGSRTHGPPPDYIAEFVSKARSHGT